MAKTDLVIFLFVMAALAAIEAINYYTYEMTKVS
jgi:hypothetical protein